MASTYSNLKIQLMATGENSATWGNVTNTNLGTAIEEAITGSASVAFSSADQTLTLTDTNASQTARNLRLNLTGTATAGYNLIVPAIAKAYIVNNGTDGTITVKNATGTGIAVPTGKTMWVYNTGVNVVDATSYLTSLALGTALPITSGGTGANSASAARTALSAAASGGNTDITSLSPTGSLTLNPTTGTVVGSPTGGVKGAGTINATGLFVNGVAVGVGSGSVSSVSGSGGTTGLTLTGGPITTSGTLTLGGTLAVASGGTGQTSYTNGQLLIGNTTGNTLALGTLTAGAGITITNGAGSITIATSGGSGTVTSVGGTGTVNGLTLTGTVTTSGNLTLGGTLSGIANSALTNSAITINGTSVSLGGTISVGTVTSVGGTGSVNGLTLSGTVTGSGSLTLGGSVTSVATTATINSYVIGYLQVPQSTNTTAAIGDVGKHLYVSSAVTINASVFSVGDSFVIVNSSGSSINITQGTSVTLRLAGTATTGTRALAAYGMASVLCVVGGATPTFMVSGAGVT